MVIITVVTNSRHGGRLLNAISVSRALDSLVGEAQALGKLMTTSNSSPRESCSWREAGVSRRVEEPHLQRNAPVVAHGPQEPTSALIDRHRRFFADYGWRHD